MNKQRFWRLIEAARNRASDPNDGEAVARRATSLLATHPAGEIVAAQQVLWDLMAGSYTNPLWACPSHGSTLRPSREGSSRLWQRAKPSFVIAERIELHDQVGPLPL
ncbi:DUF4240 domain-containing protein [Streptomyces sp. GC420]|uniref:DUF4240 domain-containing protein n=1 Tax=Streptomyces sp. GC420 TaxID=2697568 RepID=UPI0014150830|nr:DUF4240 domain-containing protein [Streptomyces sp. GC420]NBM17655.1 DUF4240 domain-containing protein [Streptomyces sp. GC420]